MVVVTTTMNGEPLNFYMDGTIYNQLNNKVIPAVKKKDFDYMMVIDGEEGSGKSVLAMQLAKVLDPDFSLDHIAFTPDDFVHIVTTAKQHSCIVFDEAFTGLSSRSSFSEVNRLMVGLMMEMRQRNLFIIIVMPSIFMLERYVVLHRAKCMFHVFINDKGSRGEWIFYNRRRMKNLWMYGKKDYNYYAENYMLVGHFSDVYTVDEQSYRDRKRMALKLKDRKYDMNRYKYQRNMLVYVIRKELGLTTQQMADLFKNYNVNLGKRGVCHILANLDDNPLKTAEGGVTQAE